jgi:hypothetical protein
VVVSAEGSVGGAGGCPTVRASIVSAAGVKIDGRAAKNSTPNNHLAAGPHRGVIVSRRGRVGDAGGHPAIRARVVSAAGVCVVKRFIDASPDNHLTASPYPGVTVAT